MQHCSSHNSFSWKLFSTKKPGLNKNLDLDLWAKTMDVNEGHQISTRQELGLSWFGKYFNTLPSRARARVCVCVFVEQWQKTQVFP